MIYRAVLVGCALLFFGCMLYIYKGYGPHHNDIHIHADFAVYVHGERIHLSDAVYQSHEDTVRHEFLHLHDNDGDVLHIHAKKQTFATFLASLNILLDEDCLSFNDTTVCREDGLRLFVNDTPRIAAFNGYIPKDLDRILLTTTTDADMLIAEQKQVGDEACIHSRRCPERGMKNEGCLLDGACPAPPAVRPLPGNHRHSHG